MDFVVRNGSVAEWRDFQERIHKVQLPYIDHTCLLATVHVDSTTKIPFAHWSCGENGIFFERRHGPTIVLLTRGFQRSIKHSVCFDSSRLSAHKVPPVIICTVSQDFGQYTLGSCDFRATLFDADYVGIACSGGRNKDGHCGPGI